MEIKKAHCLFEQSGTFKNEFIRLGIPAEDYDISNNFGQTDHVIDILDEIKKSYGGGVSIFDSFGSSDLVFAFYPCTRFEAFVPLLLRGEQIQQKDWDQEKKLEYSIKTHCELNEMYCCLCEMFIVAYRKGIRMVFENPYTQPHYLTQFFSVKPTFIDKDRREMGDYYQKPTQYWFINCKPEDNLIFEALEYVPRQRIMREGKMNKEATRYEKRSLIHPQYANRFIRRYLLDVCNQEPKN